MRYAAFSVTVVLALGSIACQQKTAGAEQPAHGVREVAQRGENPRLAERPKLSFPLKDPRIVVLKSKRQLELYSAGALQRTYHAGLGFNPVDDKKRAGDGCTPEGDFYVFTKNAKSAYYLSLGVSYPNIEDGERGLREGLITRAQRDSIVKAIQRKSTPPQSTALGGLIYIHGNGAKSDWTWGCVALENEDMSELYEAVSVGTPVTIKP